MFRDHTWNKGNARSQGTRNWLGIIFFILIIFIGLMSSILAYYGITHQPKNHAVIFGPIETSGEKTKLLFVNTR